MPILIAPIFNTTTTQAINIELRKPFHLVSGVEKPYNVASRYLRNQMDESRHLFDRKVDKTSLFLMADYPEMMINEEKDWIEEIENKLNLASTSGICSIPYVITAHPPVFGITYLKRSYDGPKYLFGEEEQRIFMALMEEGRTLPSLALRRYSLSLEKKRLEDQLLDLWISLESLFAPDGKKGEITYKLRFRMAYYFGETPEKREQIADFVRQSYNHRSEIVHSGKELGKALSNEVMLLRQMARAVILNTAMEKISLNELRKRLDEQILVGTSYVLRYKPTFFENISFDVG
ncbi:HEPN domain-containing protein [Brevibacillus ruminantium]|uniref:HEPN domain-containing protein n=1 Tax=Brevibacillus ruminantium TaxID=2950604 RepID=A0ABY4WLN1_9BACL|nr:HEPN domain-containing protein [Brevibacillus ruminantium]USG68068.1 HEPN domain-containing protein [Brevibacillus ruminantium]